MSSTPKPIVLRQLLTADISASLKAHWSFLEQIDLELLGCQLVRVYPKSAEDFTLLYELDLKTAGRTFKKQIFAEWLGRHASEHFRSLISQLTKTRRSQLDKKQHQQHQLCCLPDIGLVIRCLGLDEKINSLGILKKAESLTDFIEYYLELQAGSINKTDIEILGHRLGKRCIAKVNFEQSNDPTSAKSLFIKFYKNNSPTARDTHSLTCNLYNNGFSDSYPVNIPQPLGFDPRYNMIMMKDVRGLMLTELPESAHRQSLYRSGQAIAKLHRSPTLTEKTFTAEDEFNILNHWVPLAATIFPEFRISLYKALDCIEVELKKIGNATPVLVHRDFYDKQVLFTENQTALIDFDTACMADPAIDIGNFIAHLQLLVGQGFTLPADSIQHFLDGYGTTASANWNRRITAYRRSTLLRLTCIYLFWPKYRQLPEYLLTLIFET